MSLRRFSYQQLMSQLGLVSVAQPWSRTVQIFIQSSANMTKRAILTLQGWALEVTHGLSCTVTYLFSHTHTQKKLFECSPCRFDTDALDMVTVATQPNCNDNFGQWNMAHQTWHMVALGAFYMIWISRRVSMWSSSPELPLHPTFNFSFMP